MSSHAQTELMFTDRVNKILQNMPSYVKTYIRATHNRTAPRTRYEYLKDIQKFLDYIKEQTGHFPELSDLAALNKESFEEYLEYLEHYDDNGTERTNSRASLKRKLSSLRKLFGYLFENGMLPSDEIRKVELPKLHRKEIIRLEQNEAADLLSAAEHGKNLTEKETDYHDLQSTRDTALISLLLSTGMRVSECAELDISDIDLDQCRARIVRKGGDESIVYFSDQAAEKLSNWLEQRKTKPGNDGPALFLSSRGGRMSVRTIQYLVKKYASRSVPMKHITPHKLRATYATELYNRTGDIYLVAEALGHKDVTTTKEHYAHLSEDRKMDARNVVSYGQGKDGPDACAQRPAPGPS